MADNVEIDDFDASSDIISSYDGSSSDDDDAYDVRPYMFEPIADETSDVIADLTIQPSVENTGSRDVSEWCQCGNCRQMEKNEECVCCKQIQHIRHEMECEEQEMERNGCEDAIIGCIVAHPGFEPVILNPYTLKTAYYQYRQQYGDSVVHDDNERKRYTAYRQLVRMCWGYIGRDIRVVLPSCAVLAIRKAYPSDSYTGFRRV